MIWRIATIVAGATLAWAARTLLHKLLEEIDNALVEFTDDDEAAVARFVDAIDAYERNKGVA